MKQPKLQKPNNKNNRGFERDMWGLYREVIYEPNNGESMEKNIEDEMESRASSYLNSRLLGYVTLGFRV